MTTYAETQVKNALFGAPSSYSLFLAPRHLRYVEVAPDSNADGKFEVLDIPAIIKPVDVASKLQHIAIFWHPDQLLWSAVVDLPAGTLLRVTKDEATEGAAKIAGHVPDPTHWTGHRCIGWFKP